MKICARGLHQFEGRQCNECKKAYYRSYYAVSKKAYNEAQRAKNKEYKEATKDRSRDKRLKRNFGITTEDYSAMLLAQHNSCKICQIDQKVLRKRLAVDHCHKTGKIRGLLCAKCNLGIGNLRDSVDLLGKAINYLKEAL